MGRQIIQNLHKSPLSPTGALSYLLDYTVERVYLRRQILYCEFVTYKTRGGCKNQNYITRDHVRAAGHSLHTSGVKANLTYYIYYKHHQQRRNLKRGGVNFRDTIRCKRSVFQKASFSPWIYLIYIQNFEILLHLLPGLHLQKWLPVFVCVCIILFMKCHNSVLCAFPEYLNRTLANVQNATYRTERHVATVIKRST